MSKLELLLCSPEYFGVNYVINPWMEGKVNTAEAGKAQQQWQAFKSILEQYAKLHLITPQPGVPDLVFTANAGLVRDKDCILTRFYPKERRHEEKYYKQWFLANGYDVLELEEDMYFEGAGDALFDRELNCLWAAYGHRSKLESHTILENYFDIETHSLKLVDQRYYHLDTCFCPLKGGFLLYYPKAFAPESVSLIEKIVPPAKRFAVSDEDAQNFACNAVDLREAVVFNKISESLAQTIKNWGFLPIQSELTEFLKAGGAAKCLSLKLTEPDFGS